MPSISCPANSRRSRYPFGSSEPSPFATEPSRGARRQDPGRVLGCWLLAALLLLGLPPVGLAAPPPWASKLGATGIGADSANGIHPGVFCSSFTVAKRFGIQSLVWWTDADSSSGSTVHELQSQDLDRGGQLAAPPAIEWTSPELASDARGRILLIDDGGDTLRRVGVAELLDALSGETKVTVLDGASGGEVSTGFGNGFQRRPELVLSPDGTQALLALDSTEDPDGLTAPSIVVIRVEAPAVPGGELVFSVPVRVNDFIGGNVSSVALGSFSYFFFLTDPGPVRGSTLTERFVATWDSFGSPGDDDQLSSIQARLLDGTGAPLATQFQVNTYTSGFQLAPDVATAADSSSFLIVWQSDGSPGDDSSLTSVQARGFDPTGVALADQVQVNQSTSGFQYQPAVAALADGRYLVVWTDDPTTTTPRVMGRLLGADGQPDGDEFQISVDPTSSEAEPDVATVGNDAVVVWKGGGIRVRSTFGSVFADDFESGDLSSWTIH